MQTVKDPGCGHEETMMRMVNEWQLSLLRLCYIQLQDKELAEDAVQETFLKAYRSLQSFRGECSEKTWLTRIAINTCRDMQRGGWFRHIDRRVTPDMLPEAIVQPTVDHSDLINFKRSFLFSRLESNFARKIQVNSRNQVSIDQTIYGTFANHEGVCTGRTDVVRRLVLLNQRRNQLI